MGGEGGLYGIFNGTRVQRERISSVGASSCIHGRGHTVIVWERNLNDDRVIYFGEAIDLPRVGRTRVSKF